MTPIVTTVTSSAASINRHAIGRADSQPLLTACGAWGVLGDVVTMVKVFTDMACFPPCSCAFADGVLRRGFF